MHRTIEQRGFAWRLAAREDGDLFEQMRVLRRELPPTAQYHQSPHHTHLWKSLEVEAEIIHRHRIEMLAPFRAWILRRDKQLWIGLACRQPGGTTWPPICAARGGKAARASSDDNSQVPADGNAGSLQFGGGGAFD